MTTLDLLQRTPRREIVGREEWHAARQKLLVKEKDLTRLADEVHAERRQLPWVKVDKPYVFDSPDGKLTLADLFDGRSQLIVYHFMFGPGWKEGCPSCSMLADHFDGVNLHLTHHDVTLLAASRAPLAEFLPFKRRMGWRFAWVSSHGSDFNRDYGVSFTKEEIAAGHAEYNYRPASQVIEDMHGISVFYKDAAGDVFHTYSAYARGCDILLGVHNFLDLTPKGRNEGTTMDWVRHHDRYASTANESCGESCGCAGGG